jgi:hypothetical protein
MNEVTNVHIEEFGGYIKKWQSILGLHAWRIERGTRRPKKAMAEVAFNDEGMLATYRVGVSFGAAEVTPYNLETTALHEVLHVMLRKFKLDQSEANEHEIVNMLEKLLMETKR